MLNEQRVLVTGGAGFIGSHLCEHLLLRNDIVELWVADNFEPNYERRIKERNISRFVGDCRVRFAECDLRDDAAATKLLRRSAPDCIFHLAGLAGVRPSVQDPMAYQASNVGVTTRLLQRAVTAGTRRIVFASSSSVYGDAAAVPFSEQDAAVWPVSPYAATKRSCELIAHTFHHLYSMSIACLRLFTVYGPRQRPDLAIHKFAYRILNNQPITLFGDGTSSRDYTYVDDIVDGMMRCGDWMSAQKKPCFEIFNLGNSQPVQLSDLVPALEAALGRQATIVRGGMQPGDVRRTCADITRASQAFGYAPRTKLTDGLRSFVRWLRDEP